MHDSVLQKMPKTESSVKMMKSHEVSEKLYGIFFHGSDFKIEWTNLLPTVQIRLSLFER